MIEVEALGRLRADLAVIAGRFPELLGSEQQARAAAWIEGEQVNTGERLRALRESWGLSQREFAVLLGLGSGTVNRWEAGDREPGAVAEALLVLSEAAPTKARRLLEAAQREREGS